MIFRLIFTMIYFYFIKGVMELYRRNGSRFQNVCTEINKNNMGGVTNRSVKDPVICKN